jgi:hypothetical protein
MADPTPVSRSTAPAFRTRIPGRLVDHMAGLQQAFIEPLVPLYQFHKVNMVCIEALRDEKAAHELQKYLQVNEVGCGTPKDGALFFSRLLRHVGRQCGLQAKKGRLNRNASSLRKQLKHRVR